ncbi:MAG: polyribonucleotide nucleotidyltransferase, partial [Patescibacteria group bacterium]
MSDIKTFKTQYAGRELQIEFGRLAHQTNSSCMVRYGDSVVLATVVMGKEKRNTDFFPLMVEFEEKMYAAGKIKGSKFIKREGRAGDEAILAGRLIDRGLRPLFNQKIRYDVQVIITVLSLDEDNDPDMLGIIAASAALHVSDVPFNGPIAGVRLGYANNEFIVNPTYEQRKTSSLDLMVSGTGEKVLMIEMKGSEIKEDILESAFSKAMSEMKPIVDFIDSIRKEIGKEKHDEKSLCVDDLSSEEKVLEQKAKEFMTPLLDKYLFNIPVGTKKQRKEVLSNLKKEALEFLNKEIGDNTELSSEKIFDSFFEDFIEEQVSLAILNSNKRVDGRGIEDIRPLSGEISILPRTHGSAIFQRGETQVLSTVTLGAPGDEQVVDGMEEEFKKKYMHHYNDAPFSYGEAAPLRGLGRRAIGHGALAEKALEPVLPKEEEFPYTIRVVSEVMGSNGSSSMASICGSTLSLMDAGVPIKKSVAGIAIG